MPALHVRMLRRGLASGRRRSSLGANSVRRPSWERVDGLHGRDQCHRARPVRAGDDREVPRLVRPQRSQTMVRTSRWMLLLLVLACIPLLIVMIANQQWSAAMLIGAGMLIVPTLLKWRAIFAPLRAAFDYFRPQAAALRHGDLGRSPPTIPRWCAGPPPSSRPMSASPPWWRSATSAAAPRRGRARPVAPEALEVLGLESGRRRGGDPRRPQAPARARPSRPQRLGLSRQQGPAGTGHAVGAGARVAVVRRNTAPRNRAAKR